MKIAIMIPIKNVRNGDIVVKALEAPSAREEEPVILMFASILLV
jgi:hypothetical protein